MATQTRTARQAAASKAAATRKRNAAKRSATRTKAERRAGAATSRLEALARQAERALLIPVGAALEVRDAALSTVHTYSNRGTARRQLDRFERRGESALRRNRRLERQVRKARRDVGKRANGLRSDAQHALEQVRSSL